MRYSKETAVAHLLSQLYAELSGPAIEGGRRVKTTLRRCRMQVVRDYGEVPVLKVGRLRQKNRGPPRKRQSLLRGTARLGCRGILVCPLCLASRG